MHFTPLKQKLYMQCRFQFPILTSPSGAHRTRGLKRADVCCRRPKKGGGEKKSNLKCSYTGTHTIFCLCPWRTQQLICSSRGSYRHGSVRRRHVLYATHACSITWMVLIYPRGMQRKVFTLSKLVLPHAPVKKNEHESRIKPNKADKWQKIACCYCLSFCACTPGVRGYEPIRAFTFPLPFISPTFNNPSFRSEYLIRGGFRLILQSKTSTS